MKFYVQLFLLLFLATVSVSCLKVKEYPPTPEVKVLALDFTDDGQARLVFNFTDGDGDIGLADGDTFPPYDTASKYYKNLFINYFEQRNGFWVKTSEFNYRITPITPKGKVKVLEGEMEVKLFYDTQSPYDTIKYSVQLVDKALHESNVSESFAVMKPH